MVQLTLIQSPYVLYNVSVRLEIEEMNVKESGDIDTDVVEVKYSATKERLVNVHGDFGVPSWNVQFYLLGELPLLES